MLLLLEAFLFGLAIAAAVGPIAILVMTYGLKHGPWAGLRAGAGAAAADFVYAVIALAAGAAIAAAIGPHRRTFEIVAAVVLIAFAGWMAWSVRRSERAEAKPTKPRPFLTTFALTMVNPLSTILFLGFTGRVPPDTPLALQAAVAVVLALGSLIVQSAFAVGGSGLGRMLTDPRWIRRLNLVSAAGIALFGAWGLIQALSEGPA